MCDDYSTWIRYRVEENRGILEIDRSRSGPMKHTETTVIQRTLPVEIERCSLFLCVDENTVECAVDGRWVSCRAYPGANARGLNVCSTLGMELCFHE